MSRKNTAWIRALGDGWIEMVEQQGILDASAEELCEYVYKKPTSPSQLYDTWENMPAIEKYIRARRPDWLIHTVADPYYWKYKNRNYRKTPPANMPEARALVPIGQGKKRAGIRLAQGPDDLMWQLMNRHHGRCATGSTRFYMARLIDGKDQKHITLAEAKDQAREQITNVVPPNYTKIGQLWNGQPNPL